MKTASFYFILFIVVFTIQPSFAQKYQVPENYSLETISDHRMYDKEIIKCANWLEKIKIDENDRNQKKAFNFMAEWVTGCSYVDFGSNVRVDAIFNDCSNLRVFYMSGWARNALINEKKTNKAENCIAGLKCAIRVYKTNKATIKSANFDELIKIDDKGGLYEWVTDRL